MRRTWASSVEERLDNLSKQSVIRICYTDYLKNSDNLVSELKQDIAFNF